MWSESFFLWFRQPLYFRIAATLSDKLQSLLCYCTSSPSEGPESQYPTPIITPRQTEGEQKLSGLTFCFIPQKLLLLESKTKLEVKTNGQELYTLWIFLRNGVGKTCLWKNIFCSMNVHKSKGKRIFEVIHCPFELPPN